MTTQTKPKPLTDEQIVRLVAEKVMGWPEGTEWPVDHPTRRIPWGDPGETIPDEWNPLENDADACMVLDALAEQGYNYALTFFVQPTYIHGRAGFLCVVEKTDNTCHGEAWGDTRGRAVCPAALCAVGVGGGICRLM